jgi:hypothetical protein
MQKIKIFVSYSHQNEDWVSKEGKYKLIPWLERQLEDQAEIWTDHALKRHLGDEYTKLITEKILGSDIVLLMISQDFVSSSYIMNTELPLIKHQYKNDKLKILPLLITDLSKKGKEKISWIFDLQTYPNDTKPLIDFFNNDSDWEKIKVEILDGVENKIDELVISVLKEFENPAKENHNLEDDDEMIEKKYSQFTKNNVTGKGIEQKMKNESQRNNSSFFDDYQTINFKPISSIKIKQRLIFNKLLFFLLSVFISFIITLAILSSLNESISIDMNQNGIIMLFILIALLFTFLIYYFISPPLKNTFKIFSEKIDLIEVNNSYFRRIIANDKLGLVNIKTLEILLGPVYKNIFFLGFGLWGIIDINQKIGIFSILKKKIIIYPKYDSIEPYQNYRAKVTLNEEVFYIDIDGRIK